MNRKLAQKRGPVSLWNPMAIGRGTLRNFESWLFADYGKKIEILNKADDDMRKVALGQNAYSKSMSDLHIFGNRAYSQNKLIEALYFINAYCSVLNQVVKISETMVEQLRLLDPKYFSRDSKPEFGKKVLEETEKKAAGGVGGLMRGVHKALFGDPMYRNYKEKIEVVKSLLKNYMEPAKASMKLVRQSFDRMSVARTRGDIKSWLEGYRDLVNENNKLFNLKKQTMTSQHVIDFIKSSVQPMEGGQLPAQDESPFAKQIISYKPDEQVSITPEIVQQIVTREEQIEEESDTEVDEESAELAEGEIKILLDSGKQISKEDLVTFINDKTKSNFPLTILIGDKTYKIKISKRRAFNLAELIASSPDIKTKFKEVKEILGLTSADIVDGDDVIEVDESEITYEDESDKTVEQPQLSDIEDQDEREEDYKDPNFQIKILTTGRDKVEREVTLEQLQTWAQTARPQQSVALTVIVGQQSFKVKFQQQHVQALLDLVGSSPDVAERMKGVMEIVESAKVAQSSILLKSMLKKSFERQASKIYADPEAKLKLLLKQAKDVKHIDQEHYKVLLSKIRRLVNE